MAFDDCHATFSLGRELAALASRDLLAFTHRSSGMLGVELP